MADATYVKNAIVNMDWLVEGFFESKKDGCFVAATEVYETTGGDDICVIFMNGKAFLLYDEEAQGPMSRDKFTEVLHDMVESYGSEFNFDEIDEYADSYIEISGGGEVDPDIADAYGLDGDVCQDIEERIADLSGYVEITYEDM